jgi:hypothetical protein
MQALEVGTLSLMLVGWYDMRCENSLPRLKQQA